LDFALLQSVDTSLLSGEVGAGGDLLASLSTELAVVFEPTFREAADWGKADADIPVEFRNELARVVATIDEALKNIGSGGVNLAKPRRDLDLDATLRQATAGTGPSLDVIRAFEGTDPVLGAVSVSLPPSV
jgi:hypothetical protein